MCALLHLMGPTNGFFGLTSHRREFDDVIVPTLMKENPLISNQVLPGYHGSNQLFSGDDCRPLYLHRKQRDVCRTHEGFSETLKEAIVLSVTGCQKELRYERWNCSLGRSRRFLLKKRYKETAFLNAINAASLIHTFSRACSRGQLASSCSCQASYNEISSMALTAMDAAWRWSGCSDNTDAAEAIIRNFANKKQLGRSSNVNHIDQHNFNVGLKLVKRKRSTVCKCHGVSGSCSTRSCWTVVQPMAKTTKAIRKKFLSAKKMTFEKKTPNDTGLQTRLPNQTSHSRRLFQTPKYAADSDLPAEQLVYRSASPDFCAESSWLGGVAGRPCQSKPSIGLSYFGSQIAKRSSCSVLCCPRKGYHAKMEVIPQLCNCTMDHLVVNCDHCLKKIVSYYCN